MQPLTTCIWYFKGENGIVIVYVGLKLSICLDLVDTIEGIVNKYGNFATFSFFDEY
jgi:hypothetical protein